MKRFYSIRLVLVVMSLLLVFATTTSASDKEFTDYFDQLDIEFNKDEFTGDVSGIIEIGELSSSSVTNVTNFYVVVKYSSSEDSGSFNIVVTKRNYMDNKIGRAPFFTRLIILSGSAKLDLTNNFRYIGTIEHQRMLSTRFSRDIPNEEAYFFVSLHDEDHISFFDKLFDSKDSLKARAYTEFDGDKEGEILKGKDSQEASKKLGELFMAYKEAMGY